MSREEIGKSLLLESLFCFLVIIKVSSFAEKKWGTE